MDYFENDNLNLSYNRTEAIEMSKINLSEFVKLPYTTHDVSWYFNLRLKCYMLGSY